MAKALKKKQPMSSVERFFSGASMDAALAPQAAVEDEPFEGRASEDFEPAAEPPEEELAAAPEPAAPPPAAVEPPAPKLAVVAEKPARPAMAIVPPRAEASTGRVVEPADRQREFQLTRSADETLEDLVLIYKRATGAEVARSHVLRAILKGIAERMPDLRREAQAIGPLRRPSNAKGFEEAREEFEERICDAFVRGLGGRR